jgi:licheninase
VSWEDARVPPYWRPAATAALALAAIVVSVAGAARTADFRDDFASFDSRQWVSISRPFGHGAVDPANVAVANGTLGIRLPAGGLDGGEMRTTSLYRYGSYRARMKMANAPSSVTAFFLYKRPDYAQEIDIEIFNDATRRVMLSTYSGGRQTNTVTTLLAFDATAEFHEYAIEYDPRLVRFLVDGVELQRWSSGVTNSAMYLFVNAWFPSWLAGERPATDRFTLVDWIEYDAR